MLLCIVDANCGFVAHFSDSKIELLWGILDAGLFKADVAEKARTKADEHALRADGVDKRAKNTIFRNFLF